MGVPGFSTWLRRRYPEAFSPVTQQQSFDHVYVDLPSTLHVVARKAHNKHGLHMLLHRRLDALLAATSPRQRVVLAFDGPAPLAKVLEQRRRRRREAERSIRDAAEREAAAELGAGRDARDGPRRRPAAGLSPLSLTTGTLLMLELHTSLAVYICRRLADPRHQHLRFELSDSTVKGEGELKILSRLCGNDRPAPRGPAAAGGSEPITSSGGARQLGGRSGEEGGGGRSSSASRDGETHLVVGGDSDLLLMGMISGQRGLLICDDAHDMGSRGAHDQRGSPLAFSRDAMEAAWRRDHLPPGATQEDVTGMALDLTLLSIMCNSNDYLPGCPGLQLSNKHRPGAWNLYLEMRRQPQWAGQALATRLPPRPGGSAPGAGAAAVALNGPMLLALLQRYGDQRVAARDDEASASTRDLGAGWEGGGLASDGGGGGAGAAGGLFAGHPPADPGEYLTGLEWVLSMYSTGAVSDYRFTYFGAPPTQQELTAHLRAQLRAAAAAAAAPGAAAAAAPPPSTLRGREPLLPAACALALLPARGRANAATALQHLMDADSPVAEIFAVCLECRAHGDQLRAVGREFDAVRRELTALQARLSAAPLGADGAVDAAGDLLGAADRCEAAQAKLRRLLTELSRSQHEHQLRAHPPRPFPAAELEAAVGAVPIDDYPRRERRLARFGREMVFSWAPAPPPPPPPQPPASSSSCDSGVAPNAAAPSAGLAAAPPPGGRPRAAAAGAGERPIPGWLRDCLSFASAYPRLGDRERLRAAARRIARDTLPMHPYMDMRSGQAAAAPPGAPRGFATAAAARDPRDGVPALTRQLRRFCAGAPVHAAGVAPAAPPPAGLARPALRAAVATCAARLLPRLRMMRL